MYCPNCGASVDQNTLYCMSCGFPIVSGSQDTSSEFAETESFSEAYEETGKLDENGFTPIDANVVGGVPFSDKQAFAQMPQNSYTGPYFSALDEKSFYKQFASKKTNGWVVAIIAACFLTAAVSIPSLAFGNLLSILDVVFYLVFGILLLVKKKWYFSLPVTIYSGIGTMLMLVMSGTATGIFALIAGIISTIKLRKINAAYKQYKGCGVLPQNEI